MTSRIAGLIRPRDLGAAALAVTLARPAAGTVFVLFSFGKLVRHDAEVAALDRYGILFPEATTILVGLLELGGGLLLVAGLLTRPAALLLAGNMAGAVLTAGRIEGGLVHLGLAPALLVTMLVLVWAGAGRLSVDGRISPPRPAGRRAAPTGTASSPGAPPAGPAR